MKAVLAIFAFAFSISAFADAPRYPYPQQQQPPPVELEPEQPPCVAPCQAPPPCAYGYECGGVYQQIPQKVCQIVPVTGSRIGQLYGIVRFGQFLTLQPKPYNVIQMDAQAYLSIRDRDGRPICEVVF